MNSPAIGDRFGRLTVVGDPVSNNGRYWPCECDCGGAGIMVTITDLKARAKSNGGCAGCSRVKHGHGKSTNPTYSKYQAMKQRCSNPKHKDYPSYGGRGIEVCERWQSFENFLADMGESPEGKSIDREDVNGNYEPGNCRWATKKEQANNTRRNTPVTISGVYYPSVAMACEKLGAPYGTVRQRISRGHSPEQAITQLAGVTP